MDHTGNARGYAPFIPGYYTYPVYRNVRNQPYNAAGNGRQDDTDALQRALNDDGQGGTRYNTGVTTKPAQVFVPGGVYVLSKPLDMRLNTILVGDPNDRPVFKATPRFNGDALIHGRDYATGDPTTNFFVALKNVIIDTTNIDKSQAVTALEWGISQGCHLTNIDILMPNSSTGHIGLDMKAGSAIAVTDVNVFGGAAGIRNNNQQVNIKGCSFKFCTVGIQFSGGHMATIQGAHFDTCGLGVDASVRGELGSVVLIDSTSVNSGPIMQYYDSSQDNGDRNNQIVLENVSHDGSNPMVISTNSGVKISGISHVDTWIWGNVQPGGFQSPRNSALSRPDILLDNGNFFTMKQPTLGEYAVDQVVNVKAVNGYPVYGDGRTDDSASLNAILAKAASDSKIAYFPYGVYTVMSTLYVPSGSVLAGEAWPVISGRGSNFQDPSNPKPVVLIGKPGEIGFAQIQDMRFTVGEILPGAIIAQINLAGSGKGDVALFNTLITVGGTPDSTVNTACNDGNTAGCKAAFAMVHLTSSSSAYIENMWGWTADHSLDWQGARQNIATGRGILIEAIRGTWLTGTGFEHNTLYNYNLHNSQNVFAGMQQAETAYWQGVGAQQNVPAPWTADSRFGDPDFSWCGSGDQSCRMGLAQNIDGGENLFLYGAAFWTFFHGEVSGCYNCPATVCGANCIANQARVTGNPRGLFWFGINTRCADKIILDGSDDNREYYNPGGWPPGGVIAAYLKFSGK